MKRSYSSFSASSSSSEHRIDYDVFLSFRGEDTRYNFTGHLYKGLDRKGINTFIDNNLERGLSISPELLKTIESSRCSVVILSTNYASSSWCLDELLKILQCMKDYKQIVLPIFYHVDPSHVRKQIGSFGEAFEKHVFSHNPDLEKVRSWRKALTEVANLAGWELGDREDEAEFIEDFSKDVSEKLDAGVQSNTLEDLVGMDSRVKELNDIVCPSSVDHDVRFIGICGMGGIGKTTLAKVYYEQMCSNFQSSSFLANVREGCENKNDGLEDLQNRLLKDILKRVPEKPSNVVSRKDIIRCKLQDRKVLIVLDDVGKSDHLEELAGKDNWFGSGSRIIITTRDESLLSRYIDYRIYRPEQLNDIEGLRLFSMKAFSKSSHPSVEFIELSKQVIAYAKGLPLALDVLGSFLRGKSIEEWRSSLRKLRECPEKKITEVLQISFDALQEMEKNIFLDIACFFNGHDKDEIFQILDSCGFHPTIDIKILIDKSLIHIDPYNKLRMHDLLEDMGKEIVREKSRKEQGSLSRIWDLSDLQHVMENNTGIEQVEAIVVPPRIQEVFSWEALSNTTKLRLLDINLYRATNVFIPPTAKLSNKLRILNLNGFPFTSLPSRFQSDGLVQLILWQSKIEHLWNKPMKPLNSLKILDMSYSLSFRKVEDFGVVPNLEELILHGCEGLVEVHPSITLLTSLTLLDLTLCKSLENLPTSMKGLKSLQVLILSYCQSLRNLPASMNELSKLRILDLRECENLKSLGPEELPPSLELVHVDGCTSLDTFLDPLNDHCYLMRFSATCVGCTELVRRQGSKKTALASLKRYLQSPPNPSRQFCIGLPGNEIPTWFTHQSYGLSISLEVDPNWCSSKWMGFAFSVISYEADYPIRVRINVQELEFELAQDLDSNFMYDVVNGKHLWLIYVPRDICFHTKWQNNCSPLEFSFQFSFELGGYGSDDGYECGVRLVYEQDIQDLNLHNEDADGEGDGDGDSDTDADTDGDSDADTDGEGDGDGDSDTDTDGDSDADTDGEGEGDGDSDTDAGTDGEEDGDVQGNVSSNWR